MDDEMDWLGEKLTATINRELDLIERRNSEGFTPTFERDMAFKVASLAFAAFSARGYTQGGTMIAHELHQLIASDTIATLQRQLAERDARIEVLTHQRDLALETVTRLTDELEAEVAGLRA
jgi:hypothetical protein